MSDVRNEIGAEGIRDAKTLGTSKVLLLGL